MGHSTSAAHLRGKIFPGDTIKFAPIPVKAGRYVNGKFVAGPWTCTSGVVQSRNKNTITVNVGGVNVRVPYETITEVVFGEG